MATTEIQRLQSDVKDADEKAEEAKDMASEANNAISTHEKLCALRYEGIQGDLKAIKKWGMIGLLLLGSLTKSDKLLEILKLAGG